jgi:hypothetical protein
MDRRKFIWSAGLVLPIVSALPSSATSLVKSKDTETLNKPQPAIDQKQKADYSIRIDTGLIEVGPQHIISTITYNGQFPGPLLRYIEPEN